LILNALNVNGFSEFFSSFFRNGYCTYDMNNIFGMDFTCFNIEQRKRIEDEIKGKKTKFKYTNIEKIIISYFYQKSQFYLLDVCNYKGYNKPPRFDFSSEAN